MVTSKFLDHPQELGVVAVGFSGGQVRLPFPLSSSANESHHNMMLTSYLSSPNKASMPAQMS